MTHLSPMEGFWTYITIKVSEKNAPEICIPLSELGSIAPACARINEKFL